MTVLALARTHQLAAGKDSATWSGPKWLVGRMPAAHASWGYFIVDGSATSS
jgi:hypothetical protein